MIKVTATDDHPMVLRGIETMLKNSSDIEVIATYNSCNETYLGIKASKPDILLLDINLPDCNGIEFCKTINKAYPEIFIIALTNFNETAFVKNIIRNGAKGYLLKNTDKN